MSIKHKYFYNVNDIYLVTEEKRPDFEEVDLPWNIYKDPIKLAVGYIRWSDEKQNSGHSLSIQETDILIKAKSLGFSVVVIFVEAATSAYHIAAQNRVKMTEMKEFILSNQNAKTVIFFDESRVTRLINDFYQAFIQPVREKKSDLKLYSTKLDKEWDENDPIVQMRMTLAYDDSAKKSNSALSYLTGVINNSSTESMPKRPGSRYPYGYTKVAKGESELIPDENAPIVQLIFFLYSYGYSEKKIATLLENSNIPSPSEYGHWNDSSVRYILTNRWYRGDLTWFVRNSFYNSSKKPIEEISLFSNHHNALISPSLWEITQFFRHSKNKDRMDSPFILRKLVFCKVCGEVLKTKNQTSAKSKTDSSFYYCNSCKSKVHKDVLHNKVINDFILRWGKSIKTQKRTFGKTASNWKKLCKDTIQSLTASIEVLRYKFGMLKKEDEYYEELYQAVENQLNYKEKQKLAYHSVLSRIEELQNDQMSSEITERFAQNIDHYSNEEKRAILLQSIKQIDFDFKREHFFIEYQLSPYVDIESIMNDISKKKTS